MGGVIRKAKGRRLKAKGKMQKPSAALLEEYV
jgi:hypothetical protein